MSDVAIITAIYDQYDLLKPVCPQSYLDVEWIFVTDNPPEDDQGWTVVHEPRPGVHPNRAAKRPKFLPWKYTDAPRSIWVDGSFRIISQDFAREVLEYAHPIAQFEHPWRDCLFAEADECRSIGKYQPSNDLARQRELYASFGHPEHWGLWATGVIAREHTEQVKAMGHAWLREVEQWSYQDQVSQPYVLRTAGLRPRRLPGNHLANYWLQYEGSTRH